MNFETGKSYRFDFGVMKATLPVDMVKRKPGTATYLLVQGSGKRKAIIQLTDEDAIEHRCWKVLVCAVTPFENSEVIDRWSLI